jgi:hypothetical protein
MPAEEIVERHGAYSIRRCPRCGLQFSDPMQGATGHYLSAYQELPAPAEVAGEGLPFLGWTEQGGAGLPEYEYFLTAAQQAALRLATQIFPRPADVAALDIGFGAGWFLAALCARGFAGFGLEVAERPVTTLASKGFTVCRSQDGRLPPDWPAPALITAFEVLEHLEDPVGFLRGLGRDHPQAQVMFSVPDERRWFLLGGREAHDYPPNHLTRWSPAALGTALRKAGFRHAAVLELRPSAQELSMASLRRFLRLPQPNGTSATRPCTELAAEILKRRRRARWLRPVAAGLPIFGRTACSMLAWAGH